MSLDLLVVGDLTDTGPESSWVAAAALAAAGGQAVRTAAHGPGYDAFLAVGDVEYDDGYYGSYTNAARSNYWDKANNFSQFNAIALPIPGNHDTANILWRDKTSHFSSWVAGKAAGSYTDRNTRSGPALGDNGTGGRGNGWIYHQAAVFTATPASGGTRPVWPTTAAPRLANGDFDLTGVGSSGAVPAGFVRDGDIVWGAVQPGRDGYRYWRETSPYIARVPVLSMGAGGGASYTRRAGSPQATLLQSVAPNYGNLDVVGADPLNPNQLYYAITLTDQSNALNQWMIISLNGELEYQTQLDSGITRASQQYQWLAALLAANPGVPKVVQWHFPRVYVAIGSGAGSIGGNGGYQDVWALICADPTVKLAFWGHQHLYQRFVPLGATRTPVGLVGANLATNSVVPVILGAGGHALDGYATNGFVSTTPRVIADRAVAQTMSGAGPLTLAASNHYWSFAKLHLERDRFSLRVIQAGTQGTQNTVGAAKVDTNHANITAGQTRLTLSAGAGFSFAAGDAGRNVKIRGAGTPANAGVPRDQVATIAAYVSASAVDIDQPAGVTVANAGLIVEPPAGDTYDKINYSFPLVGGGGGGGGGGGVAWNPTPGLIAGGVMQIAEPFPDDPTRWLAGADVCGPFTSADGCDSFQLRMGWSGRDLTPGNVVHDRAIASLRAHPNIGQADSLLGVAYMGVGKGPGTGRALYTRDYGDTWTEVPGSRNVLVFNGENPTASDVVAYGVPTRFPRALQTIDVDSARGYVYWGTQKAGLYRSQLDANGVPGAPVRIWGAPTATQTFFIYSITVDQATGDVYVGVQRGTTGTGGNVYRSQNPTAASPTFVALSGAGSPTNALALQVLNGNLYAAAYDNTAAYANWATNPPTVQGVYRLAGAHAASATAAWSQLTLPAAAFANNTIPLSLRAQTVVDASGVVSQRLLVGLDNPPANSGVYWGVLIGLATDDYATPGSGSWTGRPATFNIDGASGDVKNDVAGPNAVAVPQWNFALNGGAYNLGKGTFAAAALGVSDAAPNVIVTGGSNAGLFRSPDGGVTWYPVNAGLTPTINRPGAADPQDSTGLRWANGNTDQRGFTTSDGFVTVQVFGMTGLAYQPSVGYALDWDVGVNPSALYVAFGHQLYPDAASVPAGSSESPSGQVWRYTGGSASNIVTEAFGTPAASSWGAGWTTVLGGGSATLFNVAGGVATISTGPANATRGAYRTSDVAVADAYVTAEVQADKAPVGATELFRLLGRYDTAAASTYRAALVFDPAVGIQLQMYRFGPPVGGGANTQQIVGSPVLISAAQYVPGTRYTMEYHYEGTLHEIRLWPTVGGSRPAVAQVAVNDTAANALSNAGSAGVSVLATSGNTAAPVTYTVDNFRVDSISTPWVRVRSTTQAVITRPESIDIGLCAGRDASSAVFVCAAHYGVGLIRYNGSAWANVSAAAPAAGGVFMANEATLYMDMMTRGSHVYAYDRGSGNGVWRFSNYGQTTGLRVWQDPNATQAEGTCYLSRVPGSTTRLVASSPAGVFLLSGVDTAGEDGATQTAIGGGKIKNPGPVASTAAYFYAVQRGGGGDGWRVYRAPTSASDAQLAQAATWVDLSDDVSRNWGVTPLWIDVAPDDSRIAVGVNGAGVILMTGSAVDTTPPVVTIDSPAATPDPYSYSGPNGTTVTISGSASDDSGNTPTVALTVASNSYTPIVDPSTNQWSQAVPLATGSSVVSVVATDAAGNASPVVSRNVVLVSDTTSPSLSTNPSSDVSVSGAAGATYAVTGVATDDSGSVSLTANGSVVPLGAGGAFSVTMTLAAGANVLALVATDPSGNQTTRTLTITLVTSGVPVATSGATLTVTNPGVGQTTTINPGTYSPAATGYQYRWERRLGAGAAAAIAGAVAQSYTPVAGDAGYQIRGIVSPTNATGAGADNVTPFTSNVSATTITMTTPVNGAIVTSATVHVAVHITATTGAALVEARGDAGAWIPLSRTSGTASDGVYEGDVALIGGNGVHNVEARVTPNP